MTENTVLLELKEYNKLRDFYYGIREGKYVQIDFYHDKVYYIKENDILKDLKLEIKRQSKELRLWKKPQEKSIEDIRVMSIWQFLKWRKDN